MEDEVLANAGVDVFEELFKLIFSKLYEEWLSGREAERFLEFRNSGRQKPNSEIKFNPFLTVQKKNGKVFLRTPQLNLKKKKN